MRRYWGAPWRRSPKVFGSFQAFAEYIAGNLLPALVSAQAVRTIVRAALERMIADGVVYAEMSFDVLLPEFIGMRIEAFASLLAEEIGRVSDRSRVAPEIGIGRGLPPDEVSRRLKRWVATGVCRSIDLYDDENLGVLTEFAPLYRFAADHGLKLKAHAGELCGPQAVRDSVEVLNLHAVQHGVRAAEDPAVADFLARRGTLLHVCPTSNHALGVCASLDDHPARRLFDHGVKITVNSDDFALFGASVSDEILNLARMGFSAEDIARIVENGLQEIPG